MALNTRKSYGQKKPKFYYYFITLFGVFTFLLSVEIYEHSEGSTSILIKWLLLVEE